MKKLIYFIIFTLIVGVISVLGSSIGNHFILSFSDGDVTINKSIIAGTNISCNDIVGGSDPDFCSDGTGGAVDWDKIQNFTGGNDIQGCSGGQVAAGRYQNGTFNCTTPSGSGDITGVIAGTGLTGGGLSGTVTVNLNDSYVNETLIDARVNLPFLQNLLDVVYAKITDVQNWIIGNSTADRAYSDNTLDNGSIIRSNNISASQVDAIAFANNPNGTNFFATLNDLTGGNVTITETIIIRNDEGVALSAGDPVYFTSYISGISKQGASFANNSDTSKHADCLAFETIGAGNSGLCIQTGQVTQTDTSMWAFGSDLYLAEFGNLTDVRPSTANCVQKIGMVLRSHASLGVIWVSGTDRCNDVPNNINITGNFTGGYYCNATNCFTVTDFLVDTTGGGGAGDKWVDSNGLLSPNASFSTRVNATTYTVDGGTNLSKTDVNTTNFYRRNIEIGNVFAPIGNVVNITTSFLGDVIGVYSALQVITTQGLSANNITSGIFGTGRIPQDFNNTVINTTENIEGLVGPHTNRTDADITDLFSSGDANITYSSGVFTLSISALGEFPNNLGWITNLWTTNVDAGGNNLDNLNRTCYDASCITWINWNGSCLISHTPTTEIKQGSAC